MDFVYRLWDEFYVEEDIQTLAANGISHIRIPVGYWIWDVAEGEPFPAPPANDDEGQRFYLKRLLKWAENAGLKVMIFFLLICRRRIMKFYKCLYMAFSQKFPNVRY